MQVATLPTVSNRNKRIRCACNIVFNQYDLHIQIHSSQANVYPCVLTTGNMYRSHLPPGDDYYSLPRYLILDHGELKVTANPERKKKKVIGATGSLSKH
ncbi:unnamed protein product [Fructobacillus cardui]|nr:unnamed protein product [Fructobacillus cardui]